MIKSSLAATIEIQDEVFCIIKQLRQDHIEHFVKKFAYYAPNYKFSPHYKLGRWDGKIKFFQKTGKTYFFLLEEILKDLNTFDYTIKIVDKRRSDLFYPNQITESIFSHINHLDLDLPIILYDYQVDAVNVLVENGGGICLAGTGAGKTLITAALLYAYDKTIKGSITIVPNENLVYNTVRELVNCGLDTGIYSGTTKTLDHKHIVSTWQALKNNLSIMSDVELMIVDECHGLKADVLQAIATKYATNIPYRFGLTGTLPPHPTDRMQVHVAVGKVVYEIPAHQLIDRGVLSSIDIQILQLQEDLAVEYQLYCKEVEGITKPVSYDKFKNEYFAEYDVERSYLKRNAARIKWIANKIMEARDQYGNTMCLVDSIPFGRELVKHIPNSIFINGQDYKKSNDRQERYDQHKTDDGLITIAMTKICSTGISINRIFCMITIDIGKSFITVMQTLGRGLRKGKDKHHITCIDICSDLKYSKLHLNSRTQYYREARYPYKKQKIKYEKHLEI